MYYKYIILKLKKKLLKSVTHDILTFLKVFVNDINTLGSVKLLQPDHKATVRFGGAQDIAALCGDRGYKRDELD